MNSKCCMCNSNPTDPTRDSLCSECAEYGSWLNGVRHLSPEEITGKISVQDLVDKVAYNTETVHLRVFASETIRSGKRLTGPSSQDHCPQVIRAVADDQGISFTVCDQQGNAWSLWRPFRMGARFLLNGAPTELDTPDTGEA